MLIIFIPTSGRHPCAGVKVAKLEIKLILAMLLMGYDYTLVDGSGNYPKTLPKPDRNDIQQVSHSVRDQETNLILFPYSLRDLGASARRNSLSQVQAG